MPAENLISFACPLCNQHLEAPLDMAGDSISCPSCERDITVPLRHSERTARHLVNGNASPEAPTVGKSGNRPRFLIGVAWVSLAFALLGWCFTFPLRIIFFIVSVPIAIYALVRASSHGSRRAVLVPSVVCLLLVGLGFIGMTLGRLLIKDTPTTPSQSSVPLRTATPKDIEAFLIGYCDAWCRLSRNPPRKDTLLDPVTGYCLDKNVLPWNPSYGINDFEVLEVYEIDSPKQRDLGFEQSFQFSLRLHLMNRAGGTMGTRRITGVFDYNSDNDGGKISMD
jgi:hypothetical protein